MSSNGGVLGSDLGAKMTLIEAFQYVVDVKIEEGVSDFSIKGYRDHLKSFRKYLESRNIYHLNEVTGKEMRKFIAEERKRGLVQTSLNNHITYIRAGFNILREDGLFVNERGEKLDNPAKVTKLGKPNKSSYFPMPEAIVSKLLKQPDQNTFLGKRNFMIMLMILDCGIRPSELLKGELDDWTDNYYTVRGEVAKTKEPRILPLSMETRKHFHQYLRLKGGWGDPLLFPNQEGEAFNTDGFRRALRKICQKAELSQNERKWVHPYAFRHTFAYNYLEAKGNVFKLQEILGHTDLAMTRRYVKLIGADLLDAHKTVKPLSRYVGESKRRRRV